MEPPKDDAPSREQLVEELTSLGTDQARIDCIAADLKSGKNRYAELNPHELHSLVGAPEFGNGTSFGYLPDNDGEEFDRDAAMKEIMPSRARLKKMTNADVNEFIYSYPETCKCGNDEFDDSLKCCVACGAPVRMFEGYDSDDPRGSVEDHRGVISESSRMQEHLTECEDRFDKEHPSADPDWTPRESAVRIAYISVTSSSGWDLDFACMTGDGGSEYIYSPYELKAGDPFDCFVPMS